jgi:hypothetical protein
MTLKVHSVIFVRCYSIAETVKVTGTDFSELVLDVTASALNGTGSK